MDLLYVVVAILFAVAMIKSSKSKHTKHAPPKDIPLSVDAVLPYKSKYILTKNEYLFYKELKRLADSKSWIICPKVGLKDLFDITDKSNYMSWFGRIAQKHVDFLICDDMLRPLYAIELDDLTHKNTTEKDSFKDSLFKTSNIKLIRIKAQMGYSADYILASFPQLRESNDFIRQNTTIILNPTKMQSETYIVHPEEINDESIEAIDKPNENGDLDDIKIDVKTRIIERWWNKKIF